MMAQYTDTNSSFLNECIFNLFMNYFACYSVVHLKLKTLNNLYMRLALSFYIKYTVFPFLFNF